MESRSYTAREVLVVAVFFRDDPLCHAQQFFSLSRTGAGESGIAGCGSNG